jgi:hypothetical protein
LQAPGARLQRTAADRRFVADLARIELVVEACRHLYRARAVGAEPGTEVVVRRRIPAGAARIALLAGADEAVAHAAGVACATPAAADT